MDTRSEPDSPATDPRSALAVLRRFARPRPAGQEQCELCSAEIGPEHAHLIEPATRKLLCACEPCAILFSGKQGTRYKRVPRRVQAWPDVRIGDDQWAALGLPIRLAFFYYSTPAGRVMAMYPSPGGVIEGLMPADAWQELVVQNPVLGELEPDVEALLANRVGDARDYYRAPIDECFKLAGLIRAHWRGLGGGAEVWGRIHEFFTALADRSAGGERMHG